MEWGAVTIINPDEAGEAVSYFVERGVPVYADYLEMLEKERGRLDWVGIPTGIGWHRRMAVECLRRGVRVLVEKPLAPTLQDVSLIQEAERTSGLPALVGYQHTYLDETWEIKRQLVAGGIGEIRRVDALGLWPRTRSYYARANWSGRLHDGTSWILDSPLNNALSHIVNLILFFAGSELEARGELSAVEAELYRAKPIESFDTVRSVAEFTNGVRASILLSHSCQHQFHPEIRISGTDGTLVWRFDGFHTFYRDGKTESIRAPGQIASREIMFERVVDFFEGNHARVCTTEQAAGTTHWVNAVHDTAPIHDVPEDWRLCIELEKGETLDAVQDMEYYALRSFSESCPLSDLGVPWSVPPSRRDLLDYRGYEGRFFEGPVPPIPG